MHAGQFGEMALGFLLMEAGQFGEAVLGDF